MQDIILGMVLIVVITVLSSWLEYRADMDPDWGPEEPL